MDAGESYKSFRELGLSKDLARHLAMKGGWDDELKALRQHGAGFTEEEARLATVHTRQDIILVVSDLGEILREARKTNRRLSLLLLVIVSVILFAMFG